jgi:hypothetical protein
VLWERVSVCVDEDAEEVRRMGVVRLWLDGFGQLFEEFID